MPETNDRERDFTDTGKLRFPGRFDPKLLQNIPNAGDGYPGLQRAVRNWVRYYLHEAQMEQNLDLNSHNIDNINNLDVNGDCDIEGDVDIEGNIDINGTTNLDNTDIDGTLDVDGISTLNNDVNVIGTFDVVGDITVSGIVDTIDIASHNHNNTAGNGVRATGALIAWKQDYDDYHSTTSLTYVDTDAQVTINLPEDATVLITWKTADAHSTVGGLVYTIINDGSDLSETEQMRRNTNTADETSSGGSYVKNYSSGSTTWTFRIKSIAAETAHVYGIVLSIMAFKQITSS